MSIVSDLRCKSVLKSLCAVPKEVLTAFSVRVWLALYLWVCSSLGRWFFQGCVSTFMYVGMRFVRTPMCCAFVCEG